MQPLPSQDITEEDYPTLWVVKQRIFEEQSKEDSFYDETVREDQEVYMNAGPKRAMLTSYIGPNQLTNRFFGLDGTC